MSSGGSGIPWFKIAVITAITGVSCLAAGYAALNWFPTPSLETETAEKKTPLLKKKKKSASYSKSKASKSSSSKTESKSEVNDPIKAAFEICELSASELVKLPAEAKQQAFYTLLVKGEMMLKESKAEDSLTYFMKAINIVPNPSEVLKAYEQTLPAEIYSKIIANLKEENLSKTREYFEELAPASGLVKFVETNGPKLALTGTSSGAVWTAAAAQDIEEETILMSEEADIALSLQNCSVCDYCFKPINSEEVNFKLADLSFCCSLCLKNAEDTYADALKDLSGTPAYAYQQLVKTVQETKSFAPILMLRYVSALLEDELRKQKADAGDESVQVSGLFAHYDFLRPAYRAPRDSDKAEAMLIRTILSVKNADVAEFLTDEIYCAMRATVMYNSIGFAETSAESEVTVNEIETSNEDSPKKRALEPIRYAGTTTRASFFGLYHTLSHVAHSCDPNCRFIADSQIPRRLKLVSNRAIKEEEPLTIAYLPLDFDGDRKNTIASDFHIICECAKCKH